MPDDPLRLLAEVRRLIGGRPIWHDRDEGDSLAVLVCRLESAIRARCLPPPGTRIRLRGGAKGAYVMVEDLEWPAR